MTQPAPFPRLDASYDEFLFTQIPEGSNGGPLSVLSVIARSDRDPWFEAARLARLPKRAAISALSLLIAPYVDRSRIEAVPGLTAERLVALLPHSAPLSAAQKMPPKKVMDWITVVSFIALLIGACLMGLQQHPSSVQAPARADVMPAAGAEASGGS